MRLRRWTPATLAAIGALTPALAAQSSGAELWRIGDPDSTYAEMAIAGEYGKYAARFAKDPVFRVGRDRPESSWPFIHPGPADAWAGSKPHTFRVEFPANLPVGGACRLTIRLVNSHYQTPPTLLVSLNGRTAYRYTLPAGGPDASLTDPAAGKPSSLDVLLPSRYLRRGLNALSLTTVAGSWLLYDSLALEGGLIEPSGPVIGEVQAASTMLFRRSRAGLRQIVAVSLVNAGLEGRALLTVAGDPSSATTATIYPGPNRIEVPIEPVADARDAQVHIQAGTRTVSAPVRLVKERRWRVFVAPSSHTDIGYTDLQERALDIHLRNTVEAIRAARSAPGFRWNLEVAFQVEQLAEKRPDLVPALERAVARGRLGVQGLYLNMLTGICSTAEMVRVLAPAASLRHLGPNVAVTASLNDVPSAVGTMPTMLHHSGYRYFTDAVNEYRGPVFRYADPRIRQAPFWWEGPDGSRVVALLSHGYAQASGLGLSSGMAEVAGRLPAWLRGFERADYPGDAVLAYGGVSDNQLLSPVYATIARDWNRRYAFPEIVLGSPDAFFQYVERSVGARLPVLKGDFGAYWEDGAASSAHETAIVRYARTRLEAAQTLLSLRRASWPAQAIGEAWKAIQFYNEHTWGAWCSVSAPEAEQTREQWKRKARFATEAQLGSEAVVALLGAARQVSQGATVRVWNGSHVARDITVSLPADDRLRPSASAVHAMTGESMPSQVESGAPGRLVFVARAVPPLSASDYKISLDANVPRPLAVQTAEGTWETADIALRLDPRTGAVTSLKLARDPHEWVRSAAGGLNEFLYATGGEGSALINPASPKQDPVIRRHTRADATLIENGPARAVLSVLRTGPGVPTVRTLIIVRPGGRVEFRNVVHKDAVTAKEAAYFAFPLALDANAVRAHVDVPMGDIEVERGQLAGACRDWHACASYAAVSDNTRTAVLATPHAPLVAFGDIFRGMWRGRVDLNGAVYAYVLNNYWDTNYCAAQAGPLLFSFTLDLRAGPYDAVAASETGRSAALDMCDPVLGRTRVLPLEEGGLVSALHHLVPEALPALTVSGAEVYAVERDGPETVVRLLNRADRAATVTVRGLDARIIAAHETNLVGEQRRPRSVRAQRQVTITVPPRAPATLRLTTARP